MKFRVSVKQLRDGRFQARCNAAPQGIAEKLAPTREAALEGLRLELQYQLEYCPCSSIAADHVELVISEQSA